MTEGETSPFASLWERAAPWVDRAGEIAAGAWAKAVTGLGILADRVGEVLAGAGGASVDRRVWVTLAVIAALVFVGRRVLRHIRAERPTESLSTAVAGPKLFGYSVVGVFLVGLGTWSASAPLSSAAIAPGVVSPDGNRKTVQHLEGGIVRSILVREGDTVAAGQPLLMMEDIQARAQYEELRERFIHLLAMEARLEAEQADAETIGIPAELADLGTEDVEQAILSQLQLFDSRRATREGRTQILGQRIRQLEEEIAGLREVIAAQDEQLALVAQEIEGVQQLYDQGLERLPRLLALKRQQAEIRAQRASNRASIARNEQQIGEAEIQLLTMRQQEREEVNEQLTSVRADLATLRSQLPSRIDVLARTEVVAPISGTVMNVQVTTESGVIRPGDPMLDIVPDDANLIIDARVKPIDVDTVVPGQKARVLLTAYRQRNLHQVYGTLRSISADRLIDERSGEPYFLAKVEIDPAELEALGDNIWLSPGMPAEVMILTGEQTVLQYVFQPLYESLLQSFREA